MKRGRRKYAKYRYRPWGGWAQRLDHYWGLPLGYEPPKEFDPSRDWPRDYDFIRVGSETIRVGFQ